MDFPSAVATINTLLRTNQPPAFCSSWIRQHAPQAYRFIRTNVRTETGGIDWDTVTRALDRKLQRRWQTSRRGRPAKNIRDSKSVEIILNKYHDKLYTFLAPADAHDEQPRDIISIALVRIAQLGNASAKQEMTGLARLLIDSWIEQCPQLSCWDGRSDMIQDRIEVCIRRYRYSGSFIAYLFKTLELAGRGLRPIIAFSLDDHGYPGKAGRIERLSAAAHSVSR
jgi:hypothetical protein